MWSFCQLSAWPFRRLVWFGSTPMTPSPEWTLVKWCLIWFPSPAPFISIFIDLVKCSNWCLVDWRSECCPHSLNSSEVGTWELLKFALNLPDAATLSNHTVLHVVVSPNHKIVFVASSRLNFAVKDRNVGPKGVRTDALKALKLFTADLGKGGFCSQWQI